MYRFNLLNKHVFQVYHVHGPRWASLLYVFLYFCISHQDLGSIRAEISPNIWPSSFHQRIYSG